MKDKELYDLHKVPDDVIIRELRIELGKQAAYIIELEEEIKALKAAQKPSSTLSKEEVAERRKIRKEEIFNEYRQQIQRLEKINSQLRKDKEQLIIRFYTKPENG